MYMEFGNSPIKFWFLHTCIYSNSDFGSGDVRNQVVTFQLIINKRLKIYLDKFAESLANEV